MKNNLLAVFATVMIFSAVSGMAEANRLHIDDMEIYDVQSGKYSIRTGLALPVSDWEGNPISTDRVRAVLFAPGSGKSEFPNYTLGFLENFIERAFLDRGFAVIYHNKRGLGGSSGNANFASMESRAADVLAVINHYRQDPRVDGTKIGIVGHSEGGWVVQLAGSLDPDIDFVISLAGPTTSVREQDMAYRENELRCRGLSEKKIERSLKCHNLKHEFMIHIGGIFPFFTLRQMWNMLPFDPREALQTLRQPTLIALAELDNMAPATPSTDRLSDIFPAGLPDNITTYVAANTDHFFRFADSTCFDYDTAFQNPYSEDFIGFYNDWIEEHVYNRLPS